MSRRLGKGLGALLSIEDGANDKSVVEVKINDIEPNTNQPRKNFDDGKLEQLAQSIKQHGIVQPLILKKEGNSYRIVAGERRWRAARLLGLSTVPAIIKDYTEKQTMEVALIENLQREDLNPIEEAEAYEKLIKEHNLTQEEISEAIGKSRSAVANTLRLNKLPEDIKNYLIDGMLTSGHARAILSLEDEACQLKAAEEIIKRRMNVREAEDYVKDFDRHQARVKGSRKKERSIKAPEIIDLENSMERILGTKVRLQHNRNNGRIIIEYYSNEELERLIGLIKQIEM